MTASSVTKINTFRSAKFVLIVFLNNVLFKNCDGLFPSLSTHFYLRVGMQLFQDDLFVGDFGLYAAFFLITLQSHTSIS